MRTITETWTVTYTVFDVGDKVTPTSASETWLEMGKVYTVTECHEPRNPGDSVTVFVEGVRQGGSAEYLRLVTEMPPPIQPNEEVINQWLGHNNTTKINKTE